MCPVVASQESNGSVSVLVPAPVEREDVVKMSWRTEEVGMNNSGIERVVRRVGIRVVRSLERFVRSYS